MGCGSSSSSTSAEPLSVIPSASTPPTTSHPHPHDPVDSTVNKPQVVPPSHTQPTTNTSPVDSSYRAEEVHQLKQAKMRDQIMQYEEEAKQNHPEHKHRHSLSRSKHEPYDTTAAPLPVPCDRNFAHHSSIYCTQCELHLCEVSLLYHYLYHVMSS